jgi:DNA-directed RNA polymerase subunit RPC12/RpoP
MPILIVNNLEQPEGFVLGDRALIGRRPFNTVMVPDPAVSRIHAWIGRREGGRYVLADAGSRTGTTINGVRVDRPRPLADGDEIRIGPATLVYIDADELPADVAPMRPPEPPPAADPYDGGIYFDCPCGGPMWVSADMAGRAGRCRYCGERLIVPHMSGTMARPVAPQAAAQPQSSPPLRRPRKPPEYTPASATTTATARAGLIRPVPAPREVEETVPAHVPEPDESALCSICQTPIEPGEERTACPSCHLTFHAQCWQENLGCSAYGCDQVNILAPHEPIAAPDATDDMAQPPAMADAAYDALPVIEPVPFPWESILLALSFVAMGLGALAFGIPSAVVLVSGVVLMLIGKGRRRGMMIGALAVALVGGLAGYVTSKFWWQGVRVWETFLR